MKLDALKDAMRAYGLKPLSEKAEVSRTSLYNLLNGENFEGDTLSRVSRVLGFELEVVGKMPSLESVSNHLAYFGAPLFYDESSRVSMGLEESVKWGLKYAKEDGLLDSVMPYFLLENLKKLNRVKLLSCLDEAFMLQLLGYYLELASKYSGNQKLLEFTNSFYSRDLPELVLGRGNLSERARAVYAAKSNSAAKKWNVLTSGSMEDYFDRFRKWEKVV